MSRPNGDKRMRQEVSGPIPGSGAVLFLDFSYTKFLITVQSMKVWGCFKPVLGEQ